MGFNYLIGRGHIEGHRSKYVIGHNPNISIAGLEQEIIGTGSNYTFLTSAETMSIASSDTNDTSAGTGMRVVRIRGLDSDYLEIEENVILNGTTPVITTNSYLRVNDLTGIGFGSSGSNVGVITATSTITSAVHSSVLASTGASQDGIFTVPKDKQYSIKRITLNAAKTSAGLLPVVEFLGYIRDNKLANSGWLQRYRKKVDTDTANDSIDIDLTPPFTISEKTDIRASALTDKDNTDVVITLNGILSEVT